MSYPFFENVMTNEIDTCPNDMYRDLQQAFVNEAWDNTSAKFTVQEQKDIGSDKYRDVEVWITSLVADTTTGLKDTRDFLKFVFKYLDHTVKRGLYYKFDNSVWITQSYNEYNGLVQDCGVRRCNNYLKMIDPENGSVFSIPCVVDYDMAASSLQVARYIITPNNHAVVIVQANDDTLRLFKTNTRFMLSGRPFKLYGYQNALEYSSTDRQATILYMDLYLDELRDGDDVENGIADNGVYNYAVSINSNALTLPTNSSGTLFADVTLNGNEVDKDVQWASSNPSIVRINSATGVYTVVGQTLATSAVITCSLVGNPSVKDILMITVGSGEADVQIVTNPVFTRIKQHQSIEFEVEVYYNGALIEDGITSSVSTSSEYMSVTQSGDKYTLHGNGISDVNQTLTIHAQCADPIIDKTVTLSVKAVSMMG